MADTAVRTRRNKFNDNNISAVIADYTHESSNFAVTHPCVISQKPMSVFGRKKGLLHESSTAEQDVIEKSSTVGDLKSDDGPELIVESLMKREEDAISLQLNVTEELKNELGVKVWELQRKLSDLNASMKKKIGAIKSEREIRLNEQQCELKELGRGNSNSTRRRAIKNQMKADKASAEKQVKNIRVQGTKEKNSIQNQITTLHMQLSETKGQIKEMRKNDRKRKNLGNTLQKLVMEMRRRTDETVGDYEVKLVELETLLKKTQLEVKDARDEIANLQSHGRQLEMEYNDTKTKYSTAIDDLMDKIEQEQMEASKEKRVMWQQMSLARDTFRREQLRIERQKDDIIAEKDSVIDDYEAERASLRRLAKQSIGLIKHRVSKVFGKFANDS
eukprot:CAMPEP_0172517638 /NCGR_PEP_ID=MMETSP1066-20121228/286718_1 /TAXON_ID=671091 /ORGANISM="Coscinodiscus wailesii, Strain CCMP2513" /LENGTH=388 /DNA_ID=CAMNT_0013299743 /DNA_START=83 /DNA_END=1250 /DNA_ORIENTATION=-